MSYDPIRGCVLALDMATTLGWACGQSGSRFAHGVIALPKPGISMGAHLAGFCDVLCELLLTHRPQRLIVEAPFMSPGGGSMLAMEAAIGQSSIAQLMAYRYEMPFSKVASATVRKAVLGHGRPKEPKVAVMAWAEAAGYRPATHDAADALALLTFAHGAGSRT